MQFQSSLAMAHNGRSVHMTVVVKWNLRSVFSMFGQIKFFTFNECAGVELQGDIDVVDASCMTYLYTACEI